MNADEVFADELRRNGPLTTKSKYTVTVTYKSSRTARHEHTSEIAVEATSPTQAELIAAQMAASRGVWVTGTEVEL